MGSILIAPPQTGHITCYKPDNSFVTDIADVALLLAEPARVTMLWTLIDGTSRPAGELAFAANVSAQSASAHLARLLEGGLVKVESSGRHRYFSMASQDAAHLIESMASFAEGAGPRIPGPPPFVRALPDQFLHARTCYDHLAGVMAVRVMEAFQKAEWLEVVDRGPQLTRIGRKKLNDLGVDLHDQETSRRPFAKGCVDLIQRKPHLAGTLGAALLAKYSRERWILRTPKSRVVNITPKGTRAFRSLLGSCGCSDENGTRP